MFRYIGFAWDDADSTAREGVAQLTNLLHSGSPGWSVTYERKGLAVHCAGVRTGSSEPYMLQNGAGVVLGKLFRRTADGSTTMPLAVGEADSAKILASRGRALVDDYWGIYVAFLFDEKSESKWVLRDPTGVLPCFMASYGGARVFFSSMEDAARLAVADFTVSWKYIGAALACHRLELNETGLEDVSQLLGGECMELHRGCASRVFHWSPLQIARSDLIEDVALATQEMRRVARECVQAWGSSYESIVHTLSGGLDSSIVMACLQDSPSKPRITCVNYHSAGSDGDERAFARLSAQRAGQTLIERERNAALSFEPMLHMQRQSAPVTTFLYYLENHRSEAQLAAEHGATAIFSGNTGDQLFYQTFGSLAAGDYILRHGLRPRAFGVALDAARMDGLSLWSVLKDGISRRWLGRRWSMIGEAGRYSALLTDDLIESVRGDERLLHPLFRDTGATPNGKLFHAQMLVFPPALYNPLGRLTDPELVAPLYSQPLIELALRIPSYVLTVGGWERAIARRAFQHDMPREIVFRRTKGGVEEHLRAILLRNIGLVSELLLDGHLVRQGIIDRKKLASALSGSPTRVAASNVELYECFSAEAWARRWCGAHRLQAAA
jgi:asparagine synthase (glutamine-hydrolysing)